MSAVSQAQLLIDINAAITSQTSLESVGPTQDGAILAEIVLSGYNNVDGIPVTGMTIPSSFQSTIQNNDLLPDILSALMTAFSQSNGTDMTNPYLFQATVDAAVFQHIPAASGTYRLIFPDDSTAPNFDNANQFFRSLFVAKTNLQQRFALEGVNVTQTTSGADTYKLQILKNGVMVVESSIITANSTLDQFGNKAADTAGYTFDTIYTPMLTLVDGDYLECAIVVVHGSATVTAIKAGKFSNS